MKQAVVTIKYEEEKLNAIKQYTALVTAVRRHQ